MINWSERRHSNHKQEVKKTSWGWAVPSSGQALASYVDVIDFVFHFSKYCCCIPVQKLCRLPYSNVLRLSCICTKFRLSSKLCQTRLMAGLTENRSKPARLAWQFNYPFLYLSFSSISYINPRLLAHTGYDLSNIYQALTFLDILPA